jgi:hypothetical protein
MESNYCTVDTLGPEDFAKYPNNVYPNDAKEGNDTCYDVVAGKGWDYNDYPFPRT